MGYSCWQVNTTCLFLFCCLSNIITLWKDIKTLTLTPALHRLGKRPRRKSHTLDRLTVSYWFIYLFIYYLFISLSASGGMQHVFTHPLAVRAAWSPLFCWPGQQVLYIHLSGCTLLPGCCWCHDVCHDYRLKLLVRCKSDVKRPVSSDPIWRRTVGGGMERCWSTQWWPWLCVSGAHGARAF